MKKRNHHDHADPGEKDREDEQGSTQDESSQAQTTEREDASAEVQQLRAENARLLDQLQRALADMQNLRRQTRKQIDESREVTTGQILSEFLPVLDNLERAAASRGDAKHVAQGLEMVIALFRGLLERYGVERIPALGQPFDPTMHEAVGAEVRTDVPDGTVIEEVEPGYRMPGRILRVAKVRVSQSGMRKEPTGRSSTETEIARGDGPNEEDLR